MALQTRCGPISVAMFCNVVAGRDDVLILARKVCVRSFTLTHAVADGSGSGAVWPVKGWCSACDEVRKYTRDCIGSACNCRGGLRVGGRGGVPSAPVIGVELERFVWRGSGCAGLCDLFAGCKFTGYC